MNKYLLLFAISLLCAGTLLAQQSHTGSQLRYTVSMPNDWELTVIDTQDVETVAYVKDSINAMYIQTIPINGDTLYTKHRDVYYYAKQQEAFARYTDYVADISDQYINKRLVSRERIKGQNFTKLYIRVLQDKKTVFHIYIYQWDDGIRNLEVSLIFDDYDKHKVMKKAFTNLCNTL